jgi:hypothetical protein
MQADILDCCPDDSQATHLGSEHVNLIGALPHEASQTLDGIGGLNVYGLRTSSRGTPCHIVCKQTSREEERRSTRDDRMGAGITLSTL